MKELIMEFANSPVGAIISSGAVGIIGFLVTFAKTSLGKKTINKLTAKITSNENNVKEKVAKITETAETAKKTVAEIEANYKAELAKAEARIVALETFVVEALGNINNVKVKSSIEKYENNEIVVEQEKVAEIGEKGVNNEQ